MRNSAATRADLAAVPERPKPLLRSTRLAALDMLRFASGPVRVPSRDYMLTEFREFQDGELISGTRYRVIRLMGVGGMGSVYEVEHVELGKRFVLKALLRELARREDLVQRLRNEWRALGRLQHAHIVNVTDAGTSASGVPFYVMERLDGDTLAVHLKRKRRLHVLEAVAVAVQVLEALSAAHDIGIIHRDVKPANIFLVAGGGGVKLLDFGVAKIADATSVVTARGLAVGTPRYMSPEQARGERVDGRSDVYAAGLILFEMIAGVGPYDDARDANELLLAHLAREAPVLSSLVVGVAPGLERILTGMLAKDCRERPAHARVAAERLREFAASYRQLPATDAPTAAANYGPATVARVAGRNLGHKHDLPTRPDRPPPNGFRRDFGRSDVGRTRPMSVPHTTQVTVTVNPGEPFSTNAVPNTTIISPPAFDGSTTLEMATLVPAYGASSLSGPAYPAVERPERTEMLGEFTPAISADLVTRTQVPPVEVVRHSSVTPPPVVHAGREIVGTPTRYSHTGRVAAIGAGGLALVAVFGVLTRGASPASVVRGAAPMPSTTASALRVPRAVPLALLPAPSLSEQPARTRALLVPSSEPNFPTIQATKQAPQAAPRPSAGSPQRVPLLRAAVPVAVAAPKPKAKRAVSALPASGL